MHGDKVEIKRIDCPGVGDNDGFFEVNVGPPDGEADDICYHHWKFIYDWFGDPEVPGGTKDCSYYECDECGLVQEEKPEGFNDEPGPEYEPEIDYSCDPGVDFVYDPLKGKE